MMETYGEIVYANVAKSKETKESIGTAFVNFKNPESA